MLFNVELVYGGVFRIDGFPQEHMLPLLFIECPRLLFPFARQIIADATRNGGFPPLMLDPIDFAQMFQQKIAEDQAKAKVQMNELSSAPFERFHVDARPGARRRWYSPDRLVAAVSAASPNLRHERRTISAWAAFSSSVSRR